MMFSNRITIEQILVMGVLFGLLFPLTIILPLFRLAVWNIPGLILLLWIVLRGANRQMFRLNNFDLWEYSIIGVILIYFIMTLVGKDFISNLSHLNHYISCLALSFYFRRNYGKIFTTKHFIIFAFISVGLESIIGLIQQITSSEFGNIGVYFGKTPETTELRAIGDTSMGRVIGTFGTGNLVGNWIIIFLPFILYSSEYFQNKYSWVSRIIIVIMSLIAIIMTISRFNIAMYLGIIIFTIFLYIKKNLKRKIKLKISLISALILFVMLTFSVGSLLIIWEEVGMMKKAVEFRFSDTFEAASQTGKHTQGINARMEMNKGALQAFIRSPLIGVGYKNSRWIWPTVDADVPSNWIYQPHNIYMVMLVEGGIFLFIFYVIYTFYPFYKMWLLKKSNEPILIAFFLSLSACIGIQMMYITFTSPIFAGVYTMILGSAMGYFDQELIQLKGKS